MLSFLLGTILAQDPKPVADLPFERQPGRVLLKAHLNDKPVVAMLDTGAGACVADADAAFAAGAHHNADEGTYVAHGVGGRNVDAYYTSALSLKIDGLDDSQRIDYAIDLRALRVKNEKNAASVGALIGGDLLKRYVVEIDYPASRVRFYDPKAYAVRAGAKPYKLRFEDDRPVAPILIKLPGKDQEVIDALVDTGATGVTLTGSFVKKEGLLARYPDAKTFDGLPGLGGKTSVRTLPDAAGYVGIQSFTSLYLDTTKAGLSGPEAPYDAIVGGDMLVNSIVAFDYGRSSMSMSFPPPPPAAK